MTINKDPYTIGINEEDCFGTWMFSVKTHSLAPRTPPSLAHLMMIALEEVEKLVTTSIIFFLR